MGRERLVLDTLIDSSMGSAAASASSHFATEPPTMIASSPVGVSKKAIQRRRPARIQSRQGDTASTRAAVVPEACSTVTWKP